MIAQHNEVLIPYRKGKLWGVADTTGKVVIEPLYDKIKPDSYVKNCRVEKDGKWGVVTNEGELIIDFKFDYFIDVHTDDRVYDVKMRTPRGSSAFYYNGLYLFDGTELFPADYFSITRWRFRSDFNLILAIGKNGRELYAMDWSKKTLVKLIQQKAEDIEIDFDYGNNTANIEVTINGVMKKYLLDPEMLQKLFKENLPIDKSSFVKIADKMDEEESDERWDMYEEIEYEETKEQDYICARLGTFKYQGKPKVVVYKDQLIIKRKSGHEIKTAIEVDSLALEIDAIDFTKEYYFLGTYGKEKITYEDEVPSIFQTGYFSKDIYLVNWAKIKQKGKWGVIDALGRLIIPPIYEDISLEPSLNCRRGTTLFACKQQGKWGIVAGKTQRFESQVLIPFEYDGITLSLPESKNTMYYKMYHNNLLDKVPLFFVAEKQGKYAVVDYKNQIVIPYQPRKTKIILMYYFYTTAKYQLIRKKMNGLIQLYDGKLSWNVPPQYADIVKGYERFNKYKVLEMIDSKGNFLGYADFKGHLYYKD